MVMEMVGFIFKILYFKVYAPRYINTYVPSSRGRKLFAYVELLQWLLTSITTPFTYSRGYKSLFQLLGKFEFDGHRTHEHAVTHRSL